MHFAELFQKGYVAGITLGCERCHARLIVRIYDLPLRMINRGTLISTPALNINAVLGRDTKMPSRAGGARLWTTSVTKSHSYRRTLHPLPECTP